MAVRSIFRIDIPTPSRSEYVRHRGENVYSPCDHWKPHEIGLSLTFEFAKDGRQIVGSAPMPTTTVDSAEANLAIETYEPAALRLIRACVSTFASFSCETSPWRIINHNFPR